MGFGRVHPPPFQEMFGFGVCWLAVVGLVVSIWASWISLLVMVGLKVSVWAASRSSWGTGAGSRDRIGLMVGLGVGMFDMVGFADSTWEALSSLMEIVGYADSVWTASRSIGVGVGSRVRIGFSLGLGVGWLDVVGLEVSIWAALSAVLDVVGFEVRSGCGVL